MIPDLFEGYHEWEMNASEKLMLTINTIFSPIFYNSLLNRWSKSTLNMDQKFNAI
jgi:hypothetical protein